jgi:hypothetical protein
VIETRKGEEMLPITEVPKSIASGMSNYRNVFHREEGFEHVSRYVTGLIISPNKTLQGIYDLQVWKDKKPSRHIKVQCRNGEIKDYWVLTKQVRLKRYGHKRLSIVYETSELTNTPRYYLTEALHWESGKILETWSYRWSSEIFHEFGKQLTVMESVQVRNEEAFKRHFRLSCVSQSLIQRASVGESKSERFEFSNGKATIGQRCRKIAREVLRSMLELSKRLFVEGKSTDEVLDMLMPA